MCRYSAIKYATQSTDFPSVTGTAPQAKTYAVIGDLPTDGGSVGSTGFVTGNLTQYMWNGVGWYKIATVTNAVTSDITG